MGKIESAEATLAKLDAELADPTLYTERPDEVKAVTHKQQAASDTVEQLMERWEELESRRAATED